MRTHVRARKKRTRAKRGRSVVRVPAGAYKPVTDPSLASSAFAFSESLEQAA